MRAPIVSVCTALVMIAAVFAGSATYADPLVPGKPAGVRAAQMQDKEWLVFGGVSVLVAAFLIANAGSGHAAVTAQPITVVTPTTT